MCDQAPERARPLADLGAELIMFCCTSGSFLKGFGWGPGARATHRGGGRCPGAHHVERGRRGARRARYPARLHGHAVPACRQRAASGRFFSAHGVEIPALASFECTHSRDIDKVTPDAIVERVLAHRAAIDDCDGVFVSCTALRAMETVEHLEAELDKPVVTSNASALWAALRRLDVDGHGVPGRASLSERGGRLAPMTPDERNFLRDFFRQVSDQPIRPEDPRYIPLYEYPELAGDDPVELMARAIEWTPGGKRSAIVGLSRNGKKH